MSKWIKNASGASKTWVGQEIANGAYHQVPVADENEWANDDALLSDIGSGDAVVAKDDSGSTDFSSVNAAINHLKDNLPTEVVTQFEKPDKILKMACGKADTQADKYATVEIKVPGTFNGTDPETHNGRFIEGGQAWFTQAEDGDYIEKVEVVDVDNKLGYGAGFVVKTYHDDEAAAANQGWYMNAGRSGEDVNALGGYGFLPSELYLRIKAKKVTASQGTLYLNLKWGKRE